MSGRNSTDIGIDCGCGNYVKTLGATQSTWVDSYGLEDWVSLNLLFPITNFDDRNPIKHHLLMTSEIINIDFFDVKFDRRCLSMLKKKKKKTTSLKVHKIPEHSSTLSTNVPRAYTPIRKTFFIRIVRGEEIPCLELSRVCKQ